MNIPFVALPLDWNVAVRRSWKNIHNASPLCSRREDMNGEFEQDRQSLLRGDNDAWRKAGGRKKLGRRLLKQDEEKDREFQKKAQERERVANERAPALRNWVSQSIELLMSELNEKLEGATRRGVALGEPPAQWISAARQLVHSREFDVHHAARLIYVLAKAKRNPSGAVATLVKNDGFLSKWAAPVVPHMEELSTQELIVVLVSLAKLDRTPNELFMANWFTTASSRLPDLTTRELLVILVGLSRASLVVESSFGELWLSCLLEKGPLLKQELKATELAKLPVAMEAVNLKMDDSQYLQFFKLWMISIEDSLKDLSTMEVVQMLNSLRVAAVPASPEFASEIENLLDSLSLDDLDANDLVELPINLRKAGVGTAGLEKKWAPELKRRLEQEQLPMTLLLAVPVALTADELAQCGDLCSLWFESVQKRVSSMNAFEVAAVMKSASRMGVKPEPHLIRSLVFNFERLIPLAAACNLSDFLRGMADLQIFPSQEFAVTWTTRATSIFESFRPLELADLAIAWGLLKFTPPTGLMRRWDERMQICLSSGNNFSVDNLALVLRGLVQARIVPSEKFVAACCSEICSLYGERPPVDIKQAVDLLEGLAGLEILYRAGSLLPSGRLVQAAQVVSILRMFKSTSAVSNPDDITRGMCMCAVLRTRVSTRWAAELNDNRFRLTGSGLVYEIRAYTELLPLLPSEAFLRRWNSDALRCLQNKTLDLIQTSSAIYCLGRMAFESKSDTQSARLEMVHSSTAGMVSVLKLVTEDDSGDAKLGQLLWGLGSLSQANLVECESRTVSALLAEELRRASLWLQSDFHARLSDPAGEDLSIFLSALENFASELGYTPTIETSRIAGELAKSLAKFAS